MSCLAFFAPWILTMERCWAHRCLLWADALVFTMFLGGLLALGLRLYVLLLLNWI